MNSFINSENGYGKREIGVMLKNTALKACEIVVSCKI
jgi:hypothetical protein